MIATPINHAAPNPASPHLAPPHLAPPLSAAPSAQQVRLLQAATLPGVLTARP